MDAFFAAVEERDHEWLRGLPVVVGADPQEGKGRGVVSTANYKAREYGIKSALPISRAWQLSEEAKKKGLPPAVFLATNFERYAEVSQSIMAIIREFASSIEEASIDEAYFDLSFTETFAGATSICHKIKDKIREKENLTASIGLGLNKLIAKIASDIQKPNGFTVVEEKDVEAFLEPLPIRKIPGIGPKTDLFFSQKGIKTVRDLKSFGRDELHGMLGKWGLDLYEKVRGLDDSPVADTYEIKSMGEQETFPEDTRDPNFIMGRLEIMCGNVVERMQGSGFQSFRTIVFTVRFSDFDSKSRSHTLLNAASNQATLHFEALKLLMPFLDSRGNPRKKSIRLIGLRIEKIA